MTNSSPTQTLVHQLIEQASGRSFYATGEVLSDLYLEAEIAGAILPGLPINMATITQAPMYNVSDAVFTDALCEKNAGVYKSLRPHFEKAVGMVLELSYSRPAIYVDRHARGDDDNILLILPVNAVQDGLQEKQPDTFALIALNTEKLGELIQVDLALNQGYLSLTRFDARDSYDGVDHALALAKRAALEETVRVFEQQTGAGLCDNIRNRFNALYQPEHAKMESLQSRDESLTLAFGACDRVDADSAMTTQVVFDVDKSTDIVRRFKADITQNWMCRN